jgi:hypothetical protein
MEVQQAQLSPDTTVQYFDRLQHVPSGMRSELIQTMDEIGHTDWPDGHPDLGHRVSSKQQD